MRDLVERMLKLSGRRPDHSSPFVDATLPGGERLHGMIPDVTREQSLVLSNNAATGGTCFGDSGGPNFVATSMVIAGVTSFGLNGSCGGTSGVFRVDRPAVLDFIHQCMP